MDPEAVLASLADGEHAQSLVHLERIPARPARTSEVTLPPELSARLKRIGVERLWSHQAAGLEAARARRNVAVSTGTASGKSLIYQLATFEAFLAEPKATAIYLFPTKALAHDQLRQARAFALPAVRAATYDGDTPRDERAWVRRNANLIITNPDMLNVSLLPAHARWATFLKNLRLVVIDEMHTLRGVFGSHVANVIRRLRRLHGAYGAAPVFIACSATIGNPGELATRLTGLPFDEVTEDGSPRAHKIFALWNPPLVDDPTGTEPPRRYSANAQTAGLLAGLARREVRSIAFARSRRGAEVIAAHARDLLADEHGDVAGRIAAYRAGYLPEERRALERGLVDGTLLGVAATSALELGIDIGGLDACVLAGYPGTIAATWQRAGRAGRARTGSLAVLVAQDDPLDQYLVHHPEEIFSKPHESAVLDHANPNILDEHVAAAAYEAPLGDADEAIFGEALGPAVERLVEAGLLRTRGGRHHWRGKGSPAAAIDLRAAGRVVSIVEDGTGRLLGTSDGARATHTVHPGAVYLHQGEPFEVRSLDLERGVALVRATDAPFYTQARDITDIRITGEERRRAAGAITLFLGEVEVSNQVTSFVRKRLYTDRTIDETPLELPAQTLRTTAVWYTVDEDILVAAGLDAARVPGAAHAAEHAAIGLMPLIAMCDRWDIGGVSTAMHPDTGACTVFIYDGYPGGAGFAARSYEAGERHLRATADTIEACPCASGCPGCVHSPKCGNGNEPLDKAGAVALLRAALGELSPAGPRTRR